MRFVPPGTPETALVEPEEAFFENKMRYDFVLATNAPDVQVPGKHVPLERFQRFEASQSAAPPAGAAQQEQGQEEEEEEGEGGDGRKKEEEEEERSSSSSATSDAGGHDGDEDGDSDLLLK